ncbi:hypothetical protein JYU34_009988 [Plutella xylostella]|uniref:Prolyl 3,4-dihydroxylase TPA1/OFD1 N-terminal domain-containing protein n=1 Tax=Plutella xylostella TaxID=51655 RepID=A0ABQ7QHH1_PLUXY|nr:hypothetical protein JYU34_009988 [Plutella xylostella]
MSSPKQESDEVSSSADLVNKTSEAGGDGVASSTDGPRPPAKRPATTVIEISDTDTDDSDICAVTSYQASADEVKRIRGDEYSSTSSSSEYSSDSESAWEDDSVVLPDPPGAAGGARAAGAAQLNLRANRTDDPILNPKIKAEETIEKLATHWKEQKDLSTADIILTQEPFPLCLLHNFLSNPEIINNIVDDMNTLDWTRKKMDLYEFHQTADLATLTWQRSIRGIYELLKTDVMSWVSSVTGLTLTNVSASCSLYGPGDHLLVHDDLLGDRRVAFILYLAPWTPSAGRYCVRQCENGNGEEKDDADTRSRTSRAGLRTWAARCSCWAQTARARRPPRAAWCVRATTCWRCSPCRPPPSTRWVRWSRWSCRGCPSTAGSTAPRLPRRTPRRPRRRRRPSYPANHTRSRSCSPSGCQPRTCRPARAPPCRRRWRRAPRCVCAASCSPPSTSSSCTRCRLQT